MIKINCDFCNSNEELSVLYITPMEDAFRPDRPEPKTLVICKKCLEENLLKRTLENNDEVYEEPDDVTLGYVGMELRDFLRTNVAMQRFDIRFLDPSGDEITNFDGWIRCRVLGVENLENLDETMIVHIG